jgi:hypothetical protein
MQIIEDSFEQRLEKKLSYQDKNHVKDANVEAVLTRPEGSHYVKDHIFGSNLVTNDGIIFYAIQAANGSPQTNENFAQGRLEFKNSSATSPGATDTYDTITGMQSGTRHTILAGYPKQNDSDTDNTGRGTSTCSYCYSYLTSEGNQTGIVGGVIHDNASPGAGTKLLCHFTIASFDKTSSDTLKFFVNHTLAAGA